MPASHQIRVSHPGIGSFSLPYQQAMHFLRLKQASPSAAVKWYHDYNRQKIQQATKAKSSATTELTRIIDNHIKALNDLILEKFENYINDIDIEALRHNIPSGSILNHLRPSGQFQIIKKAIPNLLNEYNGILSFIRATTTNRTLEKAFKGVYDYDLVQQIKGRYIDNVIRKLQSYFDYPDGTNGKLPTSQISCNASVIRIADDIAERITPYFLEQKSEEKEQSISFHTHYDGSDESDESDAVVIVFNKHQDFETAFQQVGTLEEDQRFTTTLQRAKTLSALDLTTMLQQMETFDENQDTDLEQQFDIIFKDNGTLSSKELNEELQKIIGFTQESEGNQKDNNDELLQQIMEHNTMYPDELDATFPNIDSLQNGATVIGDDLSNTSDIR